MKIAHPHQVLGVKARGISEPWDARSAFESFGEEKEALELVHPPLFPS